MNDDRLRLRQLIDQLRTQLAASATVDADLRRGSSRRSPTPSGALADPAGKAAGGRTSAQPIERRRDRFRGLASHAGRHGEQHHRCAGRMGI